MKIRMRSSEARVEIYRERMGTIVFALSLAIGCSAFGALFFYVSDGSGIFLAFGSLFILAGVLILAASPQWLGRIKDDNGHLLLVADKAGLAITPGLGKTPVGYSWTDVSQIVLAERFISREIGEKTLSSNQIIVSFRSDTVDEKAGLTKRRREHLWRSPKGRNTSAIDFPKGEMNRVRNELARFFIRSDVHTFSKVVFDYAKNTETFEP